MGATYKADCNDIRNSKSFDICKILKRKNFKVDLYDPNVDLLQKDGFKFIKRIKKNSYDGIIISVDHLKFKKMGLKKFYLMENLVVKFLILKIFFPHRKEFFTYEKENISYRSWRIYRLSLFKILIRQKLHGPVIGLDNLNSYYDRNIKLNRVKNLKKYKKFKFIKKDILSFSSLIKIFKKNKIEKVVHLAAQAGVRYSIEKPNTYISSNIQGFQNILEISRSFKIKHLVYASSSSVYGLSKNVPFFEKNSCSHPISTYAASKRSNELMAQMFIPTCMVCPQLA